MVHVSSSIDYVGVPCYCKACPFCITNKNALVYLQVASSLFRFSASTAFQHFDNPYIIMEVYAAEGIGSCFIYYVVSRIILVHYSQLDRRARR